MIPSSASALQRIVAAGKPVAIDPAARLPDADFLVPPPSGRAVTLAQMLERREARVATQQALRQRFGSPVLTLTLVTPGPLKDSVEARAVFTAGIAAISTTLESTGARVLAFEPVLAITGPEALYAVGVDAPTLKRALIFLEERHPLGRLWDADVMAPNGISVARRDLAVEPRRCLICEEPAHACARSGRHTLSELQEVIRRRVDAWRARPAA